MKQADDLDDERTLEKLEIERRFWERRKVDWKILTDLQVKNQFTKNLEWIFDRELQDHDSRNSVVDETVIRELSRIKQADPYIPINKACRFIDKTTGYPEGDSLATLRRLLGDKRLHTNLYAANVQDLPLREFEIMRRSK